jgi:two-component system, cell cycle sensor histidine kinase and response regulator CckA
MSPPHASTKTGALNNPAGLERCPQNLMDAPIGFYVSTPAGRYISANSAQACLLGYETPAELIASITNIATQIYVDPLEREKFMRMLETQDEVVNFECRFRHRSGSIIWGR